MGIVGAAERYVRASKKKRFIFESFMNLVETDHALGWAPAGRALQVRPTSPEILDAGIPEGRWGATAGALGSSALLPIIVVRFYHNTITTLGKWNLQHWSCPALHLLALIVGVPGTGGAMVGSARGKAPAAARVAKARAEMTLNCILFVCCSNTKTLSTVDCLSEESWVETQRHLYFQRLYDTRW